MNTNTNTSNSHSIISTSFSENLKTFFNKIKRKNSFSFANLKNNHRIDSPKEDDDNDDDNDNSFLNNVDYSSDSELINSIKKKLRHKRITNLHNNNNNR